MSFRDGLTPGVRALADEMGLYDFLNPSIDTSGTSSNAKDPDPSQQAPATPPLGHPAVGPLSTSMPSRRELTARGIAARPLRPYAESPVASTSSHLWGHRATKFGKMMAKHPTTDVPKPMSEEPTSTKPEVSGLSKLASHLKWRGYQGAVERDGGELAPQEDE